MSHYTRRAGRDSRYGRAWTTLRRHVIGALLTSVLSILFSPLNPARAQVPSVEARAQALFREGVERSRVGDWEGAVAAFEHARALVPRAAVLQNLAVALERSGRYDEALRVLDEYDLLAPKVAPEQAEAIGALRTRLRQMPAPPRPEELAAPPVAAAPTRSNVAPKDTRPPETQTKGTGSETRTLTDRSLRDTQVRRLHLLAWTTGSSAVLLSGLSLATWLTAGDIAKCGSRCTEEQQTQVRRLDWTTHVLWSVGAALALSGGITYAIAARRERSRTRLSLSLDRVELRVAF